MSIQSEPSTVTASSPARVRLPSPRWQAARWVLAVALLSGLAAMPVSQRLFSSLDRIGFDLTGKLFPAKGTGKVVVIEIDKKSVVELGTDAVFRRQTHAELIGRLGDAASITFDMPFPTAGPSGFPFAHAVARNGRVVLPMPSMAASGGQLLLPDSAELCIGAAGVGQREVTTGPFGVVTGIIAERRIGQRSYPHVSIEAIRVAKASATLDQQVCRGISQQALSAGGQTAQAVMLMLPALGRIRHDSYVDVLRGRVPPEAFSGKLVFVGHSVFDAGAFRLSSLDRGFVTQPQLDALIAEALLEGGEVSALPAWLLAGMYVVAALVMLLICARTASWKMLGLSAAWAVAVVALSTVLLGGFRVWAPTGALLVCGLLIYGVAASSRLAGTLASLRRELGALRRISSGVAFQPETGNASSTAGFALDVQSDIQAAMQQVRTRQTAYVNVINLLPYPIFLEQEGRVVLWNHQAAVLLDGKASLRVTGDAGPAADDGAITVDAIRHLAARYRREAPENGLEIELDGMAHILLCVSVAREGEAARAASDLICLVDISSVKEAVVHDRQVLRHMAHDIRNPLTTILAMLEGEHVKELEAGNAQVEQLVGELRRLVDYSLGVAREFLQLSRAEHMDAKDFVPVPLADLIAETVDNLAASAEQKSIALAADGLGGDEVFVRANRDMLMRALANLIDNAIKYSSSGTSIRVALKRPQTKQANAEIIVADQGDGIPQSALPQLFEPFFQVGGARAPGSGVGLGLPFVKAVIERHGGTVAVQSQVGLGSTFRVMLPVVPVELG